MNMKKILVSLVAGAVMTTAFAISAMAADVTVKTDDELEAALGTAAAGDTIILEAGEYQAFDLARNSKLNFKGMDGATVIASDSNSCYWPCFTGTVENIVFKAADNYSYPYNYSAIIFAHDTNFGEPCDITFKNCDFISSNGNSGIHFVGDVDFYNCDFVGNNSYSAMNYCCPSGDGIVIDGCTFNGTYSFASIHLAEGAGADTTISDCEINTGLIEFGSPKNIEFSENVINSTINLWSENNVIFDNNQFDAEAKISANSTQAVATILPTNTYADGMTAEDIIVSEKDGTVEIPVAMIGEEYFLTFASAVKAAAESATESAPVTIKLAKGTFTESIILPANLSYVTIKGADNYATILKDSTIGHTGGTNDKKTNITFDGIVFENSNINLTAIYDNTKIENMTINNCKFLNIKGKAAVSINTNSLPNLVGFTFTNNIIDGVTGGSFSGLILRAAPTGDIVITGNEISNVAWNAIQLVNLTADANVTITDNIMSSGASAGVLNIYNAKCGITLADNTINTVEGQKAIAGFDPVAKIGDKQYATLEAAITAAQNGAVIDLLGNTFEISKNPGLETKHLTFKNGTMDFTNATSGDAFIWMSGDRTVAFEDMSLLIKDREEGAGMCYWMDMKSKNASASFIRCEIDFDAVQYSYISGNEPGSVYFEDCNIEAEQANFVYRAAATFVNCTFDGYADLSEGESAGNIIMWASVPCVIDNSTVHTRSLTTISSNGTIAISNNSYVYAANVYDYYGYYYGTDHESYNTNLITVDSTSTLEAVELDMNLINEASTGKITSEASAVYVQYKKTDIDENGNDNLEGADTYEIVLLGANNTASTEIINELASADLTFDFVPTPVTGAAMTYTVTPAKGVTLTQIENRYMFNYNGVDKYEETGAAIVIGTIEISGYGAYTFGTKGVDTNAVYATEIKDNIVDGFEPASGLVINSDMVENDGMVGMITDGNIAVPTRTLIVNVAFPNAVVDNVAAYQNMKVEITGNIEGVNKTVTYELGGNMTTDGTYVVTEDRLVLNDAYTVTVSGAGYRTARYSVTMNCEESKTLNFWNNVKDNDTLVEEEKDSSAKKVTFLAGDIVKDSLINIYDLSAVVSYFGENMDTAKYNDYAKYDLNRDGKIDSKDVAYVLVSWNK